MSCEVSGAVCKHDPPLCPSPPFLSPLPLHPYQHTTDSAFGRGAGGEWWGAKIFFVTGFVFSPSIKIHLSEWAQP